MHYRGNFYLTVIGRLYYPLFSLTVDMVIESFDSSNLLADNFFYDQKDNRKNTSI